MDEASSSLAREAAPFALWQTGAPIGSVQREPAVASWDRKGHPSQVRLGAYLDEVSSALGTLPDDQPLFLDLRLGIQDPARLHRQHDLENYLTPLALRLGHRRFVHASARKHVAETSEVRVGLAVSVDQDLTSQLGWSCFICRAGTGPQGKRWKQALRNGLKATGAPPLPSGPVAVHLAWRCSGARNWVSLWKPTGDAMGPVLGEPDPRNPFNPADDRITELHLHLTRDDAMAHEIDVGMWWRVAS